MAASSLTTPRTSVPSVLFLTVPILRHPDFAVAMPAVASGDPPSRPFAVAVKLQNKNFER